VSQHRRTTEACRNRYLFENPAHLIGGHGATACGSEDGSGGGRLAGKSRVHPHRPAAASIARTATGGTVPGQGKTSVALLAVVL
jgi:hypothetical protein